jgi:TetR/AcrR family transcriptional repressor of bet genes
LGAHEKVLKGMRKRKRQSIREIRRRELVEATRDVISEIGFENATISKISTRAGFSIGYLHHHFPNKDALLAETIRVLYGDMRTYLTQRLPSANDPMGRFLIVLDANFNQQQYTKENAYAWISFLARVPFNPEFVRLQAMIGRRLFSNLYHDVKQILPEQQALNAVDERSTLIDGYWVRLGVNPESIDSKTAIQNMRQISDRLFMGKLEEYLQSRAQEAG